MERLAFVFPGQGAQYTGMGRAMSEAFECSRDIFDEASAGLGRDVRRICWDYDAATLAETSNAQPGILAASIACMAPLVEAGIRPDVVAGLSLGEYTALVSAGSVGLGAAMALVGVRARLMQEAVPKGQGAMAAVIGLSRDDVLAACAAGSEFGVVEPANFNAPGQIVISGHVRAVEAASQYARQAGARRVVSLAVSAPFHCSLLRAAEAEFSVALDGVSFRKPTATVVANTTARPVDCGVAIQQALLRQIASPVLWEDSVRYMYDELGVRTFVEVGPGKVLSQFIARTKSEATTISVEDPASLEAALRQLNGHSPTGA